MPTFQNSGGAQAPTWSRLTIALSSNGSGFLVLDTHGRDVIINRTDVKRLAEFVIAHAKEHNIRLHGHSAAYIARRQVKKRKKRKKRKKIKTSINPGILERLL